MALLVEDLDNLFVLLLDVHGREEVVGVVEFFLAGGAGLFVGHWVVPP